MGARLTLIATILLPVLAATPGFAQSTPRSAMAAQNGWAALNAGHPQKAADDFALALQDDHRNPLLYLGAGLAAFLLQHDDDARAALEQALALNPALPDASRLLAEILRRHGDLAGAIKLYQQALTASPNRPELQAGLERLQRELARRQQSRESLSDHFTVEFQGPAEQALADRALEMLERAYWRISATLDAYPGEPIVVVLYTQEDFRDITQAPAWAAGAYDGRIRVPVRGALANPHELERVLSHEFTHALVHTLVPNGVVPTWLNEGLAGALEIDGRGHAAATLATTGVRLPLSALRGSFSALPAAAVPLAYAESADAAGRLLDLAGGMGVANLLRDLGAGVAFDVAFAHRMPISLAEFQARLASGAP